MSSLTLEAERLPQREPAPELELGLGEELEAERLPQHEPGLGEDLDLEQELESIMERDEDQETKRALEMSLQEAADAKQNQEAEDSAVAMALENSRKYVKKTDDGIQQDSDMADKENPAAGILRGLKARSAFIDRPSDFNGSAVMK